MKLDLVGIVESFGLELADKGGYYLINCPFHEEKSASCAIYKDTQRFFCFGCKAKGDAITFVQKFKGLSFGQAVKYLELQHVKKRAIAMKGGLLDIIISEEKLGVDVKKKYGKIGKVIIDDLLMIELKKLTGGM